MPAHVDDVAALYPPRGGRYRTPKEAYNAFLTDVMFTCPTRSQTRALAGHAVHTYRYLFRKVTPLGRLTRLGAFHGSELPFVFGNLTEASGTDAAERTLSNTMIQYWTHFAASGNPNEDAASTWPERTTGADVSLDIDDVIQPATGYRAAECDAMASWSAAH
jgi:para-nitrobenzyl esterase